MPDLLVIGAGVFGLSVAWSARRAGLSVRVIEATRPGCGASGGPVGALAPHAPRHWGALHAFQLAALVSLPARVAALEAESGVATGYARTGRLVPLADAGARQRADEDVAAAPTRWGDAGRLTVSDAPPPHLADWIAPGAAAHGVALDTLSARIEPGAYLHALAACLGGAVLGGVAVRGVDPDGPAALTDTGRMAAGTVVIAAGWQGWGLAGALAPGLNGSAVKGQAALLALNAGAMPILTAQGLYVVPHARGVAVGSTSEGAFDDPSATDAKLEEVIARARALCPPLAGAPVARRWAGLRPKPPGRTPLAGPLPGLPRVWLAGGGFRIGLGIAHAIGDGVAAALAGKEPPIALPASFRPGGG